MTDKDATRKVRFKEQETLAKLGDFLRLDRYSVEYPKYDPNLENARQDLVNVYRGDAVAGLLHIVGTAGHEGKQTLLLVEQFRMPTVISPITGAPDFELIDQKKEAAGRILELMAGVQQYDEPPLETFRRECFEETGFTPKFVKFISSFYPSPGACSEQIFLYYGRIDWPESKEWPEDDDPENSDHGDETENIKRCYRTPAEFLNLIERGELRDGKCYAAAEWMRRAEIAREFFGL